MLAMRRCVGRLAGLLLVTLFSFGAVCATAQRPSFLSVDCGAEEGQVDGLGIEWVTDEGYISTGLNLRVPVNADPGEEAYITSRYFPEKRNKHCYVLPAIASTSYLVRAVILHGEASELPLPANFNVTLNSNSWFTIRLIVGDTRILRSLQYEAILYNMKDHIDICLIEAAQGIPWISSLELREMPSGSYVGEKGYNLKMLSTEFRYNLGTEMNDLIRWPSDKFDRLWYPANKADFPNAKLVSNSSGLPTTSGYTEGYQRPPEEVMIDAVFFETELTYTWTLPEDTTQVYLVTYYQDVRNITATTSNPVGLLVDFRGSTFELNVTDDYAYFVYFVTGIITKWTVSLTISKQQWYEGEVFLNAIECYKMTDVNLTVTSEDDVTALLVLQATFGLSSWTGDPCYPVSYDWITCDGRNRISGLYLSNKNLTGTIPEEIGELTWLREIYLDNNKISGSIPASLTSLLRLTVLALDNNSLSGSIPSGFQSKSGFTFSGNQDLGIDFSRDKKKSNNTGVIVGVIVGVALAVVLVIFLIFWWIRKRNPMSNPGKNPNDGIGGGGLFFHSGQSSLMELKPNMIPESPGVFENSTSWPINASDILGSRVSEASSKNKLSARAHAYQVAGFISMNEVLAATRNHQRKIGEGGYGPVYYGKLANGEEVAVKVNKIGAHQGNDEFINEVRLLTRTHHKNLVSLLAFCEEGDERVLIYEYQHNGTLSDLLYGPNAASRPLSWKARLEIALDAAKGLDYLHTGCKPPIIHRDIKSSNILIDDKMVAKVADFGISKSTLDQQTSTGGRVSTVVKGTPGYLDPEYVMLQKLSQKSDVYSFGVVLMEIIAGRGPISLNPDGSQSNIIKSMQHCLQTGDIGSIADPALNGRFNLESMWKVAELAWSSVDQKGVRRPDMSKVVQGLKEARDME